VIYPESADKPFSRAELLERLKTPVALIYAAEIPCDAEMINAGQSLRVLATVSVGFDHLDLLAAANKGVAIVNTPYSVTEPTAELTIGLIICCARGIARADRELRRDLKWCPVDVPPQDMVLSGATLGVIGFGRIGRAVARKAAALGLRVIYHSHRRASLEDERQLKATYLPAREVLARADVVSLHMPYTKENHHYLDEESLALMKPTAFLINPARGSIVSEKALIKALKANQISGAGLDVFENEPTISPELAGLENVVLAPHMGTRVVSERRKMLNEALQGALAVLRGEKPYNLVIPR
jgi:glyoxylate reductase